MRNDLTLLAAIAALAVGFLAGWSNPQRALNRVFLTLSFHAALWLLSLRNAFVSENGLFWLRTSCAVGAFIPVHLWFVKEFIVTGGESFGRMIIRSRWWVLAGMVLAIISFSTWFIPTRTTYKLASAQVYGLGYYTYTLGLVFVYLIQCREAVRQMREQVGVKRLELQVVLLGGSAAAVTVMLLMAFRALLGIPWLVRLQPLVILAFYTGTVVAMTTYRVFDARQLLMVAIQKTTLIVIVAAGAYLADFIFSTAIPEPFALLTTTGIALWAASILNAKLDKVFRLYPQATMARQAAFEAARFETRSESLEHEFLKILKGWGQTEHALLLSGTRDSMKGGGIELSGESIEIETLRELRWATPERLIRERSTPGRLKIGEFIKHHCLGIVVIGEGPTLTTIVGVGVAASRRPFTYPQVTQLMELTSIIESALERAHFSIKAQHAEQLATVGLLGASLAHEIRNPLVSIKTFIHLLPTHHQDAAFRQKFFRLIGDEVGRIDRLTEQLLDLASPRVYLAEAVELHPVLHASLDLVAAKAADKGVEFRTQFDASPDVAFTDASAAKQVMLNLCFNAIQAVESWSGERWVKVSTANTANGLEMSVGDSGPGIPAEIRPRLFQPFQSTKSTGFGLGLAICSDILANLNATISVDPPSIGCGATFRVTFPCRSLSS